MPFTFSHPAIILPFTKIKRPFFSTTGLVIGSLIPDFEYFIRMRILSKYSHSLEGLFWFDVPLGILIAFIFHKLIRRQFISNSPSFLKSRLISYLNFDWKTHFKTHWLALLVSIFIGAASHIFWDNFTHHHGYFVERISFLETSVLISKHSIPVLKILQHASSLIGAIFIIIHIHRLPKYQLDNTKINWNYWLTFLFFSSCIFTLRIFGGLSLQSYGNVIVSLISSGILALIFSSWIFKRFIK